MLASQAPRTELRQIELQYTVRAEVLEQSKYRGEFQYSMQGGMSG